MVPAARLSFRYSALYSQHHSIPCTPRRLRMPEHDKTYTITVKNAHQRRMGITKGHWDVGLAVCCTDCVPNCCMVSCCPWVSIAQVSARLGMTSYSVALVIALVLVLCTCGTGWLIATVWIMSLRGRSASGSRFLVAAVATAWPLFAAGAARRLRWRRISWGPRYTTAVMKAKHEALINAIQARTRHRHLLACAGANLGCVKQPARVLSSGEPT